MIQPTGFTAPRGVNLEGGQDSAFGVGYAIGTGINYFAEDAVQAGFDWAFGDPFADPDATEANSNAANDEGSPCGPDDPCKGLRDQLMKHLEKLENYRSNPYGNDNRGFLANNPAHRHRRIIDGRIRNLQRQIENFRRLLEECEARHGKH